MSFQFGFSHRFDTAIRSGTTNEGSLLFTSNSRRKDLKLEVKGVNCRATLASSLSEYVPELWVLLAKFERNLTLPDLRKFAIFQHIADLFQIVNSRGVFEDGPIVVELFSNIK
jgi:hypothetical protein